jgi:type II secretory pathway pseudopilin PulG
MQERQQMRHSRNGFTLIDIIIILAVFGALMGAMVPLTIKMVHKKRELQTVDELEKLRVAISGNALIVLSESRAKFGYLGDMGNLPSSLEDLYKKGSQPVYSFDITKKTGAGWDGPYIAPRSLNISRPLKRMPLEATMYTAPPPLRIPLPAQRWAGRLPARAGTAPWIRQMT